MTRRRRPASTFRLVVLILLLAMAMWLMWKFFMGVPPAPPPKVSVGTAAARQQA